MYSKVNYTISKIKKLKKLKKLTIVNSDNIEENNTYFPRSNATIEAAYMNRVVWLGILELDDNFKCSTVNLVLLFPSPVKINVDVKRKKVELIIV